MPIRSIRARTEHCSLAARTSDFGPKSVARISQRSIANVSPPTFEQHGTVLRQSRDVYSLSLSHCILHAVAYTTRQSVLRAWLKEAEGKRGQGTDADAETSTQARLLLYLRRRGTSTGGRCVAPRKAEAEG